MSVEKGIPLERIKMSIQFNSIRAYSITNKLWLNYYCPLYFKYSNNTRKTKKFSAIKDRWVN